MYCYEMCQQWKNGTGIDGKINMFIKQVNMKTLVTFGHSYLAKSAIKVIKSNENHILRTTVLCLHHCKQ